MGWFDGFAGGLHDTGGTLQFAPVGGDPDRPPLLFLQETAALLSGHLLR